MMMKECRIVASTLAVWSFVVALAPAQSWNEAQIPAPNHVVRQLSSVQLQGLLDAVRKLVRTAPPRYIVEYEYLAQAVPCRPGGALFFRSEEVWNRLSQLSRGDRNAYFAAERSSCGLQAKTKLRSRGEQSLVSVWITAHGIWFEIKADGSVRYRDIADLERGPQEALGQAIAFWQAWGRVTAP